MYCKKKAIRVFFRFDEKCQKFLKRRILHVFNNCLLKKVMEIRRWTGKHCTFIDCIVALSPIAPYHHSTAKLRRNMSIKISSNIGLCVQKEFFKPRSCSLLSVRLEIIISNHVCFYIKKKEKILSNALFSHFHRCDGELLKWKQRIFYSQWKWNITTSYCIDKKLKRNKKQHIILDFSTRVASCVLRRARVVTWNFRRDFID